MGNPHSLDSSLGRIPLSVSMQQERSGVRVYEYVVLSSSPEAHSQLLLPDRVTLLIPRILRQQKRQLSRFI